MAEGSKVEASRRQVEQTRRLYANLISRPLEASQLARPSFKFIQELARSLIKETRILREAFKAQDFDSLGDRRFREQFVRRLLDYAASNGAPVTNCVPARVVAGLEPGKTNELLQALARVAQQRRSSQQAKRPRTFTKAADGPAQAQPQAPAAQADVSPTKQEQQEQLEQQQQQREQQQAELSAGGELRDVINQAAHLAAPVSPERRPPKQAGQQPQPQQQQRAGQMRLATSESDIAKNIQLVRSRLRTLGATMEQLAALEVKLKAKLISLHQGRV